MRKFMTYGLALAAVLTASLTRAQEPFNDAAMEKLGWKLAMQCWTLRNLSLLESIEFTRGLGVHYLELIPGQRISPEHPEKFGPNLDAHLLELVKSKLAENGIQAVAYGVTSIPSEEAAARAFFRWAKDLGLEVINTEPKDPAELVKLAVLAKEFQIKIGLHNHPKPSTYWNPEFTLSRIQDLGPWVGACTDTGHYLRSGLSTLESLKKLQGHIVSMHLKDPGSDMRDKPFGTGVNKMALQLAELRRQGFKGVMSIEYEVWDKQQRENLVSCLEFLTHEMGGTAAP